MKDYLILSRDEVIAKYINGKLEVVNESLLPMYLQRNGAFEIWLSMRAIDEHRPSSRFLKKALRMVEKDDISTVLKVNAVTITDTYWVKEIDSNLTYKDVAFDEDFYSTMNAKVSAHLALTGSGDSWSYLIKQDNFNRTPELTNIGSFEKCWKFERGNWWMYKEGNRFERFSEMFIYNLGMELGFNMATYVKTPTGVKTKDFTENNTYNFEPAYSYIGEEEGILENIEKLQEIAPHAIKDYIQMVYLDAIVRNYDRHTFNYGLLRDPDTGDIVSFAPNFDNNNALISRGYANSNPNRTNDPLIATMNKVLEIYPEYREFLPRLDANIIRRAITKTRMKVRRKVLINFLMNAYNQLEL